MKELSDMMNGAYINCFSNGHTDEDKNRMSTSDQSRCHPSGDPSLDSAKVKSTDSNLESSNSDKEMGEKR